MKWLLCCCSESTNAIPEYWNKVKSIVKKNKSFNMVLWNASPRRVGVDEIMIMNKGSGSAKPQNFVQLLNKHDTVIIITDGAIDMKDIVMVDSVLDGMPFNNVTIHFIHNQKYINHLFVVPFIGNTKYVIKENNEIILKGLSVKGLNEIIHKWIITEINEYVMHQNNQIDAPLSSLIACILTEGDRMGGGEWTKNFCVELKQLKSEHMESVSANKNGIWEHIGNLCNKLREICDRFDSEHTSMLIKSKLVSNSKCKYNLNPNHDPKLLDMICDNEGQMTQIDWQKDPCIATAYKRSLTMIDKIFQNISHHYSLVEIFMARANDHRSSLHEKKSWWGCSGTT